MNESKKLSRKAYKWTFMGLVVSALLVLAVFPAFSEKRPKAETIEASAMGTGTQLGQVIGISVEIYEFSTPEDRTVLMDAFSKGQNQGLVTALGKMRAVGHIFDYRDLGIRPCVHQINPHPDWPKDPLRHEPSAPIWRSVG